MKDRTIQWFTLCLEQDETGPHPYRLHLQIPICFGFANLSISAHTQSLFLLSSRPGSCRDHLHLLSALRRTLLTKEKQSTTRMWTLSSCREGGLLFVAVGGLLIVVEHSLGAQALGTQAPVVATRGLSSWGPWP